MTAGIVGLGLIGGSFAKAYKAAGHRVLAMDIDRSVVEYAIISGVSDGELTDANVGECDIVLIAVYPKAAVDYMRANADRFSKDAVIIDCCGTKREVCAQGFGLAAEHGFTYIGGHPMAGTQYSGLKYSRADMFKNAPMVLVPYDFSDILLLSKAKELLAPAGFGKITVTTAEKHDEMIAFTSQLAHVVSNAYIKSPTAGAHKGFSAGSYKDMTRVAWLNPNMWAELFLDNKDYLVNELDIIIKSLGEYRDAIEGEDIEELIRLLDEGRRIKEEVDGNK